MDGGMANESPATNFSSLAPKATPQPSLPNVISVGQLLESVCNSHSRLLFSIINMGVQDCIRTVLPISEPFLLLFTILFVVCLYLINQVLHVAGQVAVSSVSTSPLPYGTMASQCEALGMGSRKKLSSWLVNGYDSAEDSNALDLQAGPGPHVPQKVTFT